MMTMTMATQDKEAAVLAADAWAEHEGSKDEPVEEWMQQVYTTIIHIHSVFI